MTHEPRSIFTSRRSFSSQRKDVASDSFPVAAEDAVPQSALLNSEAPSNEPTATESGNKTTASRSWEAHPIEPTPGDANRGQPVDNWKVAVPLPPPPPPRQSPTKPFEQTLLQRRIAQGPVTPRSSGSKRAAPDQDAQIPRSEPLTKKPRSHIRPRHTLDPSLFATGHSIQADHEVTSPLFFSHTPRQRPALLPTFSSSEAASKMLNRREELSGVTTLKLARGSISTSPPRALSTTGSWASLGRGSTPRSPDSSSNLESSAFQVLGTIGIVDLLEQDERPTFIVDLANTANFSSGQLQLLYANASLRAYDSILEMVTGKSSDMESPGAGMYNNFPEFKAWVTSFVKNNESLDVCLPSFLFQGVTWSCSTLRKRLRVISGNSSSLPLRVPSESTSASQSASGAVAALTSSKSPMPGGSPLREVTEAHDYFGDALSSSNLNQVQASSPLDMTSPMLEDVDGIIGQVALSAPVSVANVSTLSRSSGPTSSFDWTMLPLSSALPPHVRFARSIDWASTSLGPIESWSFDLRAMCNLIMGSPHPAAMYWGDDYIAIYNEAYVLLAGQKHPELMGQSYKTAWSEIWGEIEEVFVNAKQSGQATMKDDDCLFTMRNGYLEESYFSWSIVPLVGEDGSVVGLYNPAFEKTRRKIAERRMLTLREVGERSAAAREVKGFWGQVLKGLEYNEYDVPFVYMYSISDENDSDLGSMHSGSLSAAPQCVLEGTLGVPVDHPSVISPLDLRATDLSWAPYLREAMKTDKPVLLTTEDGVLADLIAGLEFRGFGDPCRAAVVCPIHPTTGDTILGFLVMGVNPRRPYDDDYSLFIQLLSRQLATSMASVVLFEEEIRRGQRAARLAAQDRIELSKQLDLRTREVAESETKFTRMAEFAPVGMFIANHQGRIIFSNETWWDITRHAREENSADSWMDCVMEEDREMVEAVWHKVAVDKITINHEFRVKASWTDANGQKADTWVLMNAYPEKHLDGDLKSIFGCLTNISQQKYAEDFQKRRMEEAVELKRQQENFIDITSHEMRNPLSAILQCADEIATTLSDHKKANSGIEPRLCQALDSSIDAAQTVTLCAQHQKRIVDDVLTLSKLDSALLLVTPVDVQPVSVVQRALKMFEGELDTNDIGLEFQVEPSYLDLGVDYVKADPSRLLQVLINLTTNAIKFTHSQEKRTIVVSIGASKVRPTGQSLHEESTAGHNAQHVSYFPSRSKRTESMTSKDWGTGEEIFILFAVQDTGRGLDNDEKNLLFRRFSQASPRTHVQYGGSGLGLFISRELTELQGGEIGVASERGVGSTFAFYVKARRASRPSDAPASLPALLRKSSGSGKTLLAGEEVLPEHIRSAERIQGKPMHKLAQPLERPAASTRTSSMDARTIKVLIVEDNLVNQRVLQKQLKNLGCIVHVANHGEEALATLKKSRFWKGQEKEGNQISVVLMDLEMPVMDGLTCTRRIRELEVEGTISNHVPIIAVTANARLEQIETAMAAGMDDVVSKPFRIPELIPKIEELIEKCKRMAMVEPAAVK